MFPVVSGRILTLTSRSRDTCCSVPGFADGGAGGDTFEDVGSEERALPTNNGALEE